MNNIRKPHMLKSEIKAFENILKKISKNKNNDDPVRVIEWGSGYSTKYYTNFLKENNINYNWVAIEHDDDWFPLVEDLVNDDENIQIIKKDLGDDYVKPSNQTFDLALVDGRIRNECVDYAKNIAKLILLHDAQRKNYSAVGTFIAPRLMIVEEKQNIISKAYPFLWKNKIKLWRIKERILGRR